MRSDTACSRSNAPEIAPARRRVADNPPSNAHPVVTPWWPPPLYLTYTTFTLSHSQESPGSVESGAGWVCGLLGVQPGVGATTARRAARFRPFVWSERGLSKIRPSAAISALHEGPWQPSMRAYAFPNYFLDSGMCVVCVPARLFSSTPPPTSIPDDSSYLLPSGIAHGHGGMCRI